MYDVRNDYGADFRLSQQIIKRLARSSIIRVEINAGCAVCKSLCRLERARVDGLELKVLGGLDRGLYRMLVLSELG